MEHTHLVKGLDYSLLKKTKSEAVQKEESQEKEDDGMAAFEVNTFKVNYCGCFK